jgi:sucrose phosphorylase
VLIAYPDHLRRPGVTPLRALRDVVRDHLAADVSIVHLLPLHPASGDDGFAVCDYETVAEKHGTWDDVEALGSEVGLMFDFVLNHVSSRHEWFRAFLAGTEPYTGYFVVPPEEMDLDRVRRPRTSPLLTTFQTARGERRVWTTFGPDQVDLDYANPEVLVEMLRVLLMYVRRGAVAIRLDAAAYLWKESGTACVNLPQTHALIRIMRHALDAVAPDVSLVSEANVSARENLGYLGGVEREAQLVYNFPLAALLIHAIHTGDATRLSRWASSLRTEAPDDLYLNVTATHDGIPLRPVRGILRPEEVQALIDRSVALVSYAGAEPYELDAAYIDALSGPGEHERARADRFVVSQAVMLALRGLPGIYLPSLVGAPGWPEGVSQGGSRAINRRRFDAGEFVHALGGDVSARVRALLRARREEPAFHPQGAQRILDLDRRVFAIERVSPDRTRRVLALHNLSDETVRVEGVELGPYEVSWSGA